LWHEELYRQQVLEPHQTDAAEDHRRRNLLERRAIASAGGWPLRIRAITTRSAR
jgi:hypothetical protein